MLIQIDQLIQHFKQEFSEQFKKDDSLESEVLQICLKSYDSYTKLFAKHKKDYSLEELIALTHQVFEEEYRMSIDESYSRWND